MEIFLSRCAMLNWQLGHPWALLLGPVIVALSFLVTKFRNR